MKKQIIRLTEGDLHRMISEVAHKVLSERFEPQKPDTITVTMEVEFPGDEEGGFEAETKEVEFICYYDYSPEEAQTYDYPGCSAQFTLGDVDYNNKNLYYEDCEYLDNVWIKEHWNELEEKAEETFSNGMSDQYDAI